MCVPLPQVGGRHGDNRRRNRQSQTAPADDKEQYAFFNHRNYKTRRHLVARSPAYPGLPYITPYYFPKMTYFDIPYIRNEVCVCVCLFVCVCVFVCM